jgi:hypothetical protein
MVIAQIAVVFGDQPELGFYAQFVEYLREGMQGKGGAQRFRDGFMEFLIMAKKMWPGDNSLFARRDCSGASQTRRGCLHKL